MPRYFFHLYEGAERLSDLEGIELSGADAVPAAALREARGILAGDVYEGRLALRSRIEVTDDAGRPVHALLFADALMIDWPASNRDPPSADETIKLRRSSG